jgi:NAD(P)-dependent dehydrogenase (short-subunit alcohol dehydrogenase family)
MSIHNVCLIVGAGPGIGQACALAFAREGCDIAVASRHPEKLQSLTAAIAETTHRRARAYAADAGDFASLRQLVDAVGRDLGDPDVVIFNAAGAHRGRPMQVHAEHWVEDFRMNVGGALALAQMVAPAMRARGRGTLLLTGGGFAHEPAAAFASLSASKAALRNLTYTLAQELGTDGIHVATVTVYGVVQTGTAFDPTRIAQSFVALHRQRRGAFETELVYK